MKIVKSWNINMNPEYRGFRCANCQKYIKKAWHYLLSGGYFNTPVHFCANCNTKFSKNLKNNSIYKNFTCDKCGKKMQKAWHVWQKKGKTLKENHFCKECGEEKGLGKNIKAVVYDLDGTLISTVRLHELAWIYAGKKFNVPISDKFLIDQKGVRNESGAEMVLPAGKKYLIDEFVKAKEEYLSENMTNIDFFPGTENVIRKLIRGGYKVWVFTGSDRRFVKKILKDKKVLNIIKNNFVWREMYKKAKPSGEGLKLALKRMKIENSSAVYVGDAFSDYKSSMDAKVKFVYFCPDIRKRDSRIPKSITAISFHKEIFKFLN